MTLYMYIAPGQGQIAPRGQSFDVNTNQGSYRRDITKFPDISLTFPWRVFKFPWLFFIDIDYQAQIILPRKLEN